jgi:BirA family biotin operon repressor/biotin-[acetyl-CoA-carboxylase] ligase
LRSSHSDLPADLAEALECNRRRLGRIATRVLHFETIGSTNDVAISLAGSDDAEGAVVLADEQTAGRGRRGHTWFSPALSGLYVSIVLTPRHARRDPKRATTLLTLATGLALAEAIEATTALRADLKWPNDLQVARRKLAGILAEAVAPSDDAGPRAVVIGYGINVGASAYPREIADRVTSLETELGRSIDRTVLVVETLALVSARYEDLLAGRFDAILDAWRDRAPASRGAQVSWKTGSGELTGRTAGIDEQGALLVRVGDRIERIVGGEVIWT